MPYIAPPGNAANVELTRRRYTAPAGNAVTFELRYVPGEIPATDLPPTGPVAINFTRPRYIPPPGGNVPIELSPDFQPEFLATPVPGVIRAWGMSWKPDTPIKQSTVAIAFQQAQVRQIQRGANAASTGTKIEKPVESSWGDARQRHQSRGLPWGRTKARERFTVTPYRDAADRDIEALAAAWRPAGDRFEAGINLPFLVDTPKRDRTIRSGYFSVDRFGNLWRREDNLPPQFAAVQPGRADLTFLEVRSLRVENCLDLAPPFPPPRPNQPKDILPTLSYDQSSAQDLSHSISWGPGGTRDNSVGLRYPDYVGPVDEIPVPGLAIIPTRRFYIVVNSASIVRVSDGRDIPATAVSLSIDSDSFAWQLSANVAGRDALALVEGTDGAPVECDVLVNGYTWRVLVDGWQRAQSFSQTSATIRGRSRAAYLAAPYSLPREYVENTGLNAQQLAAQELPPGWTLDWRIVDWFVPTGAWRYSGLAPMDAIARIAAAAGGVVQADRVLDTIRVLPRYPAAPWRFNTIPADVSVPEDIMVQRDSTKKPGQGVNGVFVHGGNSGGILVEVVRQGTAGDKLAPTIVDDLITDTQPARQRGIAAISASGRQSAESYALPLDPQLGGLIEVGAILAAGREVVNLFTEDFRGVVRSVNVTAAASRATNGGVSLNVRQNIEIERHFDEAGP